MTEDHPLVPRSEGECVMCEEVKAVNDMDICEGCWPDTIFAREAAW